MDLSADRVEIVIGRFGQRRGQVGHRRGARGGRGVETGGEQHVERGSVGAGGDVADAAAALQGDARGQLVRGDQRLEPEIGLTPDLGIGLIGEQQPVAGQDRRGEIVATPRHGRTDLADLDPECGGEGGIGGGIGGERRGPGGERAEHRGQRQSHGKTASRHLRFPRGPVPAFPHSRPGAFEQ